MKKPNKKRLSLLLLFLLICALVFVFRSEIISFLYGAGPVGKLTLKVVQPVSYLSFDDLEDLAKPNLLTSELSLKLQRQLTTPYVVNSIVNKVLQAKLERPFIRVAQWNIERGGRVHVIKEVFKDPSAFYYKYKKNLKGREKKELKNEIEHITKSDVICLNEVDIGMPRTNYANITRELARILGYNYVFATEFVELGPIINGRKFNKNKYLGLHGNAILSRFPVVSTKIIQLPQCYDWYGEELKKKSPLEYARRAGAKVVFEEKIADREVRRGGRNALVVDIKLSTGDIVTVVSTHFEDRCFPECRLKQMKHLLLNLRNNNNPIVLAGDFNTSTTDSAPTSFRKEITKRLKDPNFVARQIAFAAIPGVPIAGSFVATAVSKILQYKDPAFPNIPIIFPNMERELFKYLKEFTFSDGGMFDLNGNPKRSKTGKGGFLANSNERGIKGFESTFKFEEPRFIAYFKLDWFFIKPKGNRFRPFNGQTLNVLNKAYPELISDHAPLTVDLEV